jgi:hypothetical protein
VKTFKPVAPLSHEDIQRFWDDVDKRSPDECWPWKGPRFADYVATGKRFKTKGYGRFYLTRDGKFTSLRTNRVALYLATGIDPAELEACYTCHNVICCNGRHLFAGTDQDRMDECVSKNRQATGDDAGPRKYPESRDRGEDHHWAKLTRAQAQLIMTAGASVIEAGLTRPGRRLPKGFVAQVRAAHPEIAVVCDFHIARILRGQAWAA